MSFIEVPKKNRAYRMNLKMSEFDRKSFEQFILDRNLKNHEQGFHELLKIALLQQQSQQPQVIY